MIETIKHLLGICGEPHGLLYILMTVGGITTLIRYIKLKIKREEKWQIGNDILRTKEVI